MTKSSGDIVKYIESLFKSNMSCDKKKKKKTKKRKESKKTGSKRRSRKRSKHSNKRQLNSLPARYSYYM
jgi:hypothetical protein